MTQTNDLSMINIHGTKQVDASFRMNTLVCFDNFRERLHLMFPLMPTVFVVLLLLGIRDSTAQDQNYQPFHQSEWLSVPAFFNETSETVNHANRGLRSDATLGRLKDVLDPDGLSPTLTFGRSSLSIQKKLAPLVEPFNSSIVQIVGEREKTTLGTIVSSDGLIVAKYSSLPSKLECELSDGTKVNGVLIGIQRSNDLALIQIEAAELQPITFGLTLSPQVAAGDLVVSAGNGKYPIGFGMVTVRPQTFGIEQTSCAECVDLGATVSTQPETIDSQVEGQTLRFSGLKVKRVYPRTASEHAGLLVGDLLQTLNGHAVASPKQLNQIAQTIRVGQQLTMEVVRDGRSMNLTTKVQAFSKRVLHDRWGGGPFSPRRFGFNTVIAHDSVVNPELCGAPLIDLKGHVLGINIARSMRIATFAIPITDVYQFVKYVRPSAKLLTQ